MLQLAKRPMRKPLFTAAAAVADIPDGASILLGGFGVIQGWPHELLFALRERGIRNLTIICNSPGFGPYSPQILAENYPREGLVPLPLHLGQVVVFSLALLHGMVVNTSAITRWSCDARIKNSFASPEVRAERFMPLSRSPVTRAADRYLRANEKNAAASGNFR